MTLALRLAFFATCGLAGLPAQWARAATPRARASAVGANAFASVDLDRSAEWLVRVDLEREFALWRGFTMGAKAMPLFLWRNPDGRWVPCLAFGVTTRWYWDAADHAGPFIGWSSATVWSARPFVGNASRLNLLSNLAIGWQAPANAWHAAVQLEHLSNAETAHPNHGANAVGIAVGWAFW
ncbi:MAG: acyloxyacyl hydrolase [Deltaproteobacteria bacterium]|nr:acyloxyacyl hydrolase [Deltaproteobacteria bacterium]